MLSSDSKLFAITSDPRAINANNLAAFMTQDRESIQLHQAASAVSAENGQTFEQAGLPLTELYLRMCVVKARDFKGVATAN